MKKNVLVLMAALAASLAVMICAGVTVYAEDSTFPDINSGEWAKLEDRQSFTVDEPMLFVTRFPYRIDEGPKLLRTDESTGEAGYQDAEEFYYLSTAPVQTVSYFVVDKDWKYTVEKYEPTDDNEACVVSFSGSLTDNKTHTAALQKYFDSGVYLGSSTTYLEVEAPDNGTISLTVKPHFAKTSSYRVQLCNSEKEPLNDKYVDVLSSATENKTVFGVKKGTYYIAVSASNENTSEIFDATATFKKISVTKSGTTKKKAQTIKLGTKINNLIYYGEGRTHWWYKIKISKAGTYKRLPVYSLGWGADKDKYRIKIEYSGCKPTVINSKKVKLKKGTFYIHMYKKGNINGYVGFTLKK